MARRLDVDVLCGKRSLNQTLVETYSKRSCYGIELDTPETESNSYISALSGLLYNTIIITRVDRNDINFALYVIRKNF